jgi:hypothetical protein
VYFWSFLPIFRVQPETMKFWFGYGDGDGILAKFTKLVLDLLQLVTFGELHFTIATIMEQMPSQKGLVGTQGIADIFASGVRSTSSAINLLVSPRDSLHLPSTTRWLSTPR